jgi:hypothetical protein
MVRPQPRRPRRSLGSPFAPDLPDGRAPRQRRPGGHEWHRRQAPARSVLGPCEYGATLEGEDNTRHVRCLTAGRKSHEVRRFYASFRYQAQTWSRSRRVVAKVAWHPGELYPRVGFLVTNLARPPERVVAFYNGRGTAEQWVKEGKNALKWTRLSCRSMRANAVRLQLHALAYNLANFLRTLVLPETVERWSLTTLRERVVKIGAKVINHARYTVFQMAEVAVSRDLFRRILHMIDALRPAPVARC